MIRWLEVRDEAQIMWSLTYRSISERKLHKRRLHCGGRRRREPFNSAVQKVCVSDPREARGATSLSRRGGATAGLHHRADTLKGFLIQRNCVWLVWNSLNNDVIKSHLVSIIWSSNIPTCSQTILNPSSHKKASRVQTLRLKRRLEMTCVHRCLLS